jgi:hypothetical protein
MLGSVFIELPDEFRLPEESVEQIRGPADCGTEMCDVADNPVRKEDQDAPAERDFKDDTQ